MASQKGGSKADTLVKVVLIMFISLFSFSVGTFVGKQVSDSDHRRLALEGEYGVDRQIASTHGHEESAQEDKITAEEVETLTEEFVNKEKAAAATEPSKAEPVKAEAVKAEAVAQDESATKDGYKSYARGKNKEAQAKPQAALAADTETTETKTEVKAEPKAKTESSKKLAAAVDGAKATAEKLVEGKAPTDGKPEARKPASTLPSVASSAVGKYTVQVASFADEKEAKSQAADLKGKGWNAFYLPANVNGRTWYRVLVGLFNNYKSAKEFQAQFMKDSDTKSAIVQKIVQ